MSMTTISTISKYIFGWVPPPIVYYPISNHVVFLSFEGGTVTDLWSSIPFTAVGTPVVTNTPKYGTYCITSNNTVTTNKYAYSTNSINLTGATGLTFAFWMNVSANQAAGQSDVKVFEYGGDNKIFLHTVAGTTIWKFSYGGTGINLASYVGVWAHFAVTVTSGNVFNVYFNGAFHHTFTATSKFSSVGALYVACSTIRGHKSLNGYIDNFKMWNKILTNTEIEYVYNNVDT